MGIFLEVVIQVEFCINNWCYWCLLDYVMGLFVDIK